MDEQRRTFHAFLAMHAHKATATEEPRAHLAFVDKSGSVPHDAYLLSLDRDDVVEALDTQSELVRWLLEQMRTYDCYTQRIVGLVFDKRTVLSEVLRCSNAC